MADKNEVVETNEVNPKGMRIIGMVAENYKRIRLVEIAPKGRVVTFSGKPGQGKTSCIDAFLSAIGGKRYTQEMPVRKGAKNARIRLALGSSKVEWNVTRTISPDGTQSLTLIDGNGQPHGRGQGILDELRGDIWMDPTEFVRMKPKDQVEILRKVAKLDIDVEKLNEYNAEDFAERTHIGRLVKQLEGEVAGMVVQDGLPATAVDTESLMAALNDVGSQNDEARRVDAEKQQLQNQVNIRKELVARAVQKVDESVAFIADLERQLANAKVNLKEREGLVKEEEKLLNQTLEMLTDAPDGVYSDVVSLTNQLQEAQLRNREIEKRDRRVLKETELTERRREYERLTRQIEGREEEKRVALQNVKMPVEGLTFDEEAVFMRGIPLGQLGESEQIRICTQIAMAENPKLRVLPILHGESLGEEGIAMLAELAEEHDFQILMAMVDDSGKRGYVIEDGNVLRENAE